MDSLHSKLIRLAYSNGSLRPHLLPIIKEAHEHALVRINGKTYRVDDEGNKDYVDDDPESHGLYNDGDGVPLEKGGGGWGGSRGYGHGYGGGGGYRRRRW